MMRSEWSTLFTLSQQQELLQSHQFMQLLTSAEQPIVKLAVEGFDDRSIAATLLSSIHTIRRHIENIQHKTPAVYGRKLKFRHQLIPKLAPYLFFWSKST